MILLTVGSQLPFDRLVVAMDAWCEINPGEYVFGQLGELGSRSYRPRNFEWRDFVTPTVLEGLVTRADVIVAHAGMGSIISALRHGKPIVVMPRRAVLGEHRNEHQNATAARFADRPGIFVSSDEITLPSAIERALAFGATAVTLPQYAESRLLNSLRRYILTGDVNADIARDGMARNSVD